MSSRWFYDPSASLAVCGSGGIGSRLSVVSLTSAGGRLGFVVARHPVLDGGVEYPLRDAVEAPGPLARLLDAAWSPVAIPDASTASRLGAAGPG